MITATRLKAKPLPQGKTCCCSPSDEGEHVILIIFLTGSENRLYSLHHNEKRSVQWDTDHK